ncbi:MAG: DUF1957 domain-containing protein [Verrucomicrobia bacterium]|nr:DUF1957 domain-containing protein [Verrucomicrobiota bacterium]
MKGLFCLVLHAHLPWVREPAHPRFLEESWLFEAVAECYLPLTAMLERWWRDGLAARLTLSLSPTLAAMLSDPLLRGRCREYLLSRIELAEREQQRARWSPAVRRLAGAYAAVYRERAARHEACGGGLAGVWRQMADRGQIEVIPCSATHAVLPLLLPDPCSLRAQLGVARSEHRRHFGKDAPGFWLPECAYDPALDPWLAEAGARWSIVETCGLLGSRPAPAAGVHAPVFTPHGQALFGRDPLTAFQVWSRHGGYPGDPRYRDFFRDAGFDLESEYLRPYWPGPDHRGFTGMKYHAITGAGADKRPYDPDEAARAVDEHAAHFRSLRRRVLAAPGPPAARPPVLVAPYDAELFGHWWYEGIAFLDQAARGDAAGGGQWEWITPTDYLRRHPDLQVVEPPASSWGEGADFRTWRQPNNRWMLERALEAGRILQGLVRSRPAPAGAERRALELAAQELLLAQASDWPFMVHTNSNAGCGRQRAQSHLDRFDALADRIERGMIDEPWLANLAASDSLFPDVDLCYWRDE